MYVCVCVRVLSLFLFDAKFFPIIISATNKIFRDIFKCVITHKK